MWRLGVSGNDRTEGGMIMFRRIEENCARQEKCCSHMGEEGEKKGQQSRRKKMTEGREK